jgi:hypothetical protein
MGLEEKLPTGLLLTTVENMGAYARKSSVWPSLPWHPQRLPVLPADLLARALDAWMAVQNRAAHPYQIDHPGLAAS